MNKRNVILGSVLGMSLVGLLGAGAVSARTDRGCGFGHGGHHASAFGGYGFAGSGGLHHMLQRLDLTDEQRYKIFQIMYQQMPAVHQKMTALRKDRQALREAATSGSYDAQTVRRLADEQGKIHADLIVMRTQTRNQVYGVLTPEQQAQIARWKTHKHRNSK
jgi:protein CpxP